MPLHTKTVVADYLYSHSHFLHSSLVQCETLYQQNFGFSCVIVLFNCLENVARSAINDYESKLSAVFTSLYTKGYITEKEHDFLNKGDFCLRVIRNKYTHKNAAAINFVLQNDGRDELWPLTENDTSLMLYCKISDIVFNLMIKIVSAGYIDSVREKFNVPLDSYIDKCNLQYRILTAKELLALKGYPEDYIPDDLLIPEDAKLRIVDCAPDLNISLPFYSKIADTLKNKE